MDVNYFGLHSNPFDDRADARFYHSSASCEEALTVLEHGIRPGAGLAVVTGDAGTGKTLLIRVFLQRLQRTDQPVVATWSAGGGKDLVRECCKGFGVAFPHSNSQPRCLIKLRRHLNRSAREGTRPILVVDQAENLSPGNILQMTRLAELRGERGNHLAIILAARPTARSLLDRPECVRIGRHPVSQCKLAALTSIQTGEYIRHRLGIAGAVETELFHHQAVTRIHELSDGIPRFINQICRTVLLKASRAQTPFITPEFVEKATMGLSLREREVSTWNQGLGTAGGHIGRVRMPGAPVTDDAIDSVVMPTKIIWDETAEEAWSGAVEPGGTSIVDTVTDGLMDESPAPEQDGGALLFAKLERATLRAERLAHATETILGRLATMERRLTAAHQGLQTISQRLETMISSAGGLVPRGEGHDDRITALDGVSTHDSSRFAPADEACPRVMARVRDGSRSEEELSFPVDALEMPSRISRVSEAFVRSPVGTAGDRLQVLPEPQSGTTPVEPRATKPPTRTEDIVRLIEEAMR